MFRDKAGHVMRRNDKRRIIKVTEWQPRNCIRSQGRQRARWRVEIRTLAGGRIENTGIGQEEMENVGRGLRPAAD